jgi:hypothetical protein
VHGGMAEGFDHGPSDRRAGKLKHGLDTAIGLQEAETPIDGKDALGDAGQDSIELGALTVRSARSKSAESPSIMTAMSPSPVMEDCNAMPFSDRNCSRTS